MGPPRHGCVPQWTTKHFITCSSNLLIRIIASHPQWTTDDARTLCFLGLERLWSVLGYPSFKHKNLGFHYARPQVLRSFPPPTSSHSFLSQYLITYGRGGERGAMLIETPKWEGGSPPTPTRYQQRLDDQRWGTWTKNLGSRIVKP